MVTSGDTLTRAFDSIRGRSAAVDPPRGSTVPARQLSRLPMTIATPPSTSTGFLRFEEVAVYATIVEFDISNGDQVTFGGLSMVDCTEGTSIGAGKQRE